MNELKFRLEVVRGDNSLSYKWEAQLNDEKPQRHNDIIEAIMLTGISFGDRGIAKLIARKFGHNFKEEKRPVPADLDQRDVVGWLKNQALQGITINMTKQEQVQQILISMGYSQLGHGYIRKTKHYTHWVNDFKDGCFQMFAYYTDDAEMESVYDTGAIQIYTMPDLVMLIELFINNHK